MAAMSIHPYESSGSLPHQQSIKVRVAACHIDFHMRDLAAVNDDYFLKRINAIEEILSGAEFKPHLIVFPEGCAIDVLVDRARDWAKKYNSVVVCGTRPNLHSHIIEGIVVTANGETTFQKKNPSPYDHTLSSKMVAAGSAAGIIFDIHTASGTVPVGVLICYDFYEQHAFQSWDQTRMIICPMFDVTWPQARMHADALAQKSIRSILVNKARMHVDLADSQEVPKGVRVANFIHKYKLHGALARIFPKKWRDRLMLQSSAHGPLNLSDVRHLEAMSKLERIRGDRSLVWAARDERVIIGSYELGIEMTTGNRNRHGAGFTYDQFEVYSLKGRL